jgi:hypothetical protein
MRKTVLSLAVGIMALAPATVASAAALTPAKAPTGSAVEPISTAARPVDGPAGAGNREWVYGCKDGQAWAGIVWPDGHISGRPNNLWPCDNGDWFEFNNQ